MKFFFDNNLSPYLARATNQLAVRDGHEALALRDHPHIEPSTPDIDWLRRLGEEGGWVIVSADLRISRSTYERKVWQEARLTAFFLAKGWHKRHFWDIAWMLIRWWPQIVTQAELVAPGTGFVIPNKATGKFRPIQTGTAHGS